MSSANINSSPLTQRQSGLSLIELLIGLVLGAIVAGAVGTVFYQSQTTFTVQKELNNINADASYILSVVMNDIAHAGFGHTKYGIENNSVVVPFVTLSSGTIASTTNDILTDNFNDSITIAYRGDLHGTSTVNCLGGSVPNDPETVFVLNRYFITPSAEAGIGTLECQTAFADAVFIANDAQARDYTTTLTSFTQQPLINNVASFQIMYGIDETGTQTITTVSGSQGEGSVVDVNKFYNWDDVDLSQHTVRSVRLGLVLASERDVRDTASSITMTVLDNTRSVTHANSRKQFILFEKTVLLKNTRGQIRG